MEQRIFQCSTKKPVKLARTLKINEQRIEKKYFNRRASFPKLPKAFHRLSRSFFQPPSYQPPSLTAAQLLSVSAFHSHSASAS